MPVKLQLQRDLLPQLHHAGHGRVLVVPRHHVAGHCLAQRLGRVEIGKALGQVQGGAIGGQSRHPGKNGGADVGQLAL